MLLFSFKRLLATAVVLFASTHILAAQTISGTVLDALTKEALPGASVVQTGTRHGVETDAEGGFTIRLTEGKRSLTVSFLGFKTHTEVLTGKEDLLEILLLPDTFMGGEVFVEATRVDDSTPMSYTNINKDEIEEKNLGQDLAQLIEAAPSVVSTSDAGAGIGYTGIRIRGVDPTRINITINGIPLNDSESQSVFWVNMPDLSTSLDNLQIQRGVGTSANGAGAFGATVNLQTGINKTDPFAEVNTAVGSFNSRKANVIIGSGLMKNGWQFGGRISKIMSDGYIDRASSDLNSVYLSAAHHGKRSLLKADMIIGRQKTYQAWNGVEESILRSGNRTYNELGTEKAGEPYDDQTDNYNQNIYQLHYSNQLTEDWIANLSLHYTRGLGYFEEYHADENLDEFGITAGPSGPSVSDLITRRWLDNHFYGMVFSTKYDAGEHWNVTLGGGINRYLGDHYGNVIWARFAGDSEIDNRYYFNDGNKTDYNLYGKLQYGLAANLNSYIDLQVRGIEYEFDGLDMQSAGAVVVRSDDSQFFFNPKFGLVYRKNNHRLFTSFSVAGKEPSRDEYVKSSAVNRPKPETMYNIETGYHGEFDRFFVGLNGYGMFYKDQLAITGKINETGRAVRENIPESYRIGLELEGGLHITEQLSWTANATLSRNKLKKFTEYIDDYDNGGQLTREHKNTDIALSPSLIANSAVRYQLAGFSGALSGKYISKQYLDNTQDDTRRLDAYFVTDLLFAYRLPGVAGFKAVTASLQVNNLLSAEYESNGYTFGFISGGEQRYNYYFPQAGRNYLFQMKWEF